MTQSSLKVHTCSNSYYKLLLTFGCHDSWMLTLMDFPKLKYEITVRNTNTGLETDFLSGFWDSEYEDEVNIPLEVIEGHPRDLFDIDIKVYRQQHGDGVPVHFINLKLMSHERILQWRPVAPSTILTFSFFINRVTYLKARNVEFIKYSSKGFSRRA